MIALALSYALLLISNTSFAVGGADSSGYFNAARNFASGHVSVPVRGFDELGLSQNQIRIAVPLGFVPSYRPGQMASFYPIGFPLHIAGLSIPGFVNLPFLISPIAALLAAILTFVLGRELGISPIGSFGAAVGLAACPVLIFHALQPMSDVVALVWSILTILLALRSSRSSSAAFLSGAAFGIACLVRPTSSLLLLPLGAALPLHRWKSVALFGAGAMPALLVLLLYNEAAFGSYLTSGYGLAGLAGEFSPSYFVERFWHYSSWTARQLTPVSLILWAALLVVPRVPARIRMTLILWFGSFFIFHCFYKPYEAWWYTRFLLPAYPAVILGAFLMLELVCARIPRWRAAIQITLAGMIVIAAVAMTYHFHVLHVDEEQETTPRAAEWLIEKTRPDAWVVCMEMSGALTYYSDLIPVRWDWLDAASLSSIAKRARDRKIPIVALLMDYEAEAVHARFPDQFVMTERFGPYAFGILDQPPHGFADRLKRSQVRGWAFDPDLVEGDIEGASLVRAVATHRDGTRVVGNWYPADLPRLDLVLNGATNQPTHAFILDIAEMDLKPGEYEISVEAQNHPSGVPVSITGSHRYSRPSPSPSP